MHGTVTPSDSVLAVGSASRIGDNYLVGSTVLLRNRTATAPVFLEVGAVATETDGYEWLATDGAFALDLEQGEELHAIVAAGQPTQTIHILKTGRS